MSEWDEFGPNVMGVARAVVEVMKSMANIVKTL